MKEFANRIDRDLEKGIKLEDCLLRLGGALDAWLGERFAEIEARLTRLESTVTADKQNMDEVDSSVRTSWESLNERLKKLEDGQ